MRAFMAGLLRREALIGLALLALLVTPPLRPWLEGRMWTHMLLQFPALALAGALLAGALSASLRTRLAAWNAHGVAGLTLAALVMALAMIPRLLDLALVDARMELAKCGALLLCGATLRLSWRDAATLVQGFFLGNVLPMMAIVGWLYETAAVRLCKAYRLDEQQWVGQALAWTAAAVAAVWLAGVFWRMTRPPTSTVPG